MNMTTHQGSLSHTLLFSELTFPEPDELPNPVTADQLEPLQSLPLDRILSLLPIACAIFDHSGCCTYLNPEGRQLLGAKKVGVGEILFYQFNEEKQGLYPHDRLPFIRALQEEKIVMANDVIIFRQGRRVVLEMQAMPLSKSDSGMQEVIVLFKDITPSRMNSRQSGNHTSLYQDLVEALPGAFQYTIYPNGQGRLTYLSPNFYDFYGIEASWLLENPNHLCQIISPETLTELQAEIKRSYATLTPWRHQGILLTPNGKQWFQGYAIPEKRPNGDVVWQGLIFDIPEPQKLDDTKIEAEIEAEIEANPSYAAHQLKYLSQILHGAPFGYVLKLDGFHGLSDIDESIEQLCGVDRQSLLNQPNPLEAIVHPEDRQTLKVLLTQAFSNLTSWNFESRIITPQGKIKWIRMMAYHEARSDGSHVWNGMMVDITERKQVETILADYRKNLEQEVLERTLELELEIQDRKRAEEQARRAELALRKANAKLEQFATLDGLTQIANRRRFDDFLSQTWRMMIREGQKMSVILGDVDYFKQYNDTYGHQAGDACLQKIADVLKKTVNRAGDLVARYGGEEFAIILSNTDEIGARSICYNLRWAIAELNIEHSSSQVSSHITLSLGVSTMIPTLQVLPESLLSCADKALYQAKAEGRDRAIYTSRFF